MAKSKWYSIRQHTAIAAAALAAATGAPLAAASSAEILIYGEIGDSWLRESVSASDFVRELNALDVQQIIVRINSIGGSVPDGIAIHNAMKRHKAHITTVIEGWALSIASLVALGGDRVEMADNAGYMVHAPWTYTAGNAAELREVADILDTWARAMAASYAAKTGKPEDEMLRLLTDGRDHWYTAAEAKEAGFIDEVISSSPQDVMAALDLTRFRDVPAAFAQARRTPAAAAAQPTEISMTGKVDNPKDKAALEPDAQAIEQAKAEGAAAERQRIADIRAAFQPFAGREGMAELLAQCESDVQCTVAEANRKILAALAKGAEPVAGSYVVTLEDEADKRRNAAVMALLARAGAVDRKGQRVRADGQNPYRGMRLIDVARASLERVGVDTRGLEPMRIVALAFTQSSSDFPILLENTMHKALQAAYAVQADTWSRFCKRGSVSDFRAHNRYRLGSFGNLDPKTELGEFRNKTIPDGEKASVQISTKGNIINISREAIINDDLDAFVGLATALGRAARRTVEADVYATLTSNSGMGPILSDGKTLFHTDHGNIGSAGAPSVTTFDDARVKMASQKDVSNNDFLDIRPAVWLGPLGLGGTARVVNDSQYDPDTANKLQRPNMVRGLFSDIVDTPRLTGTAWYAFADPDVAPVLEVAFLDGNDEPYLELQDGFTVDGARWKVRLDYGVCGIDHRGAVRNAGA